MNQQIQPVRHLIIVPSESSGAELVKSLGAVQGSAIGIETATALGLAKKQLSAVKYKQRAAVMTKSEAAMIMLQALKACQEEFHYFHQLSLSMENAQVFMATYLAYRKSMITPLEEGFLPATLENKEKAKDLEKLFFIYENLKQSSGSNGPAGYFNGPQWDEADVLYQALSLSEKSPVQQDRVNTWLPKYMEYSPLEESFITQTYPHFEYVALEDLAGVLGLAAQSPVAMAKTYNLAGYGEINEVKGLLKQINNNFSQENNGQDKTSPVSLEDVVIGVVDYDTYAPIIQQAGQRYDLAVTFGDGLPMAATNPGRLVNKMIRWMNSRKAEDFRSMVYGGNFRTKHWMNQYRDQALEWVQEYLKTVIDLKEEGINLALSSHQVIKLMMDLRIGDYGPSDQEKIHQYQELALEEVKTLWQGVGQNKDHLVGKDKHSFNEWLRMLAAAAFMTLFFQDLTPSPLTQCKTILSKYSWIRWKKTPVSSAGQKSWAQLKGVMDAAAKKTIHDALDQISEEESVQAITRHLEHVLKNTRVGRSTSQPGHLHLVPWQDLAWVWRKHVCIAGVDQERFPGMVTEDPILLDEDKVLLLTKRGIQPEKIAEHVFLNGLKTVKKRHDMNILLQVLVKRAATLVLSYTNFNLTEYRATLPDQKSLQILSLDPQKPNWENGFINMGKEVLDETEYWLSLKDRMPGILTETASTFQPLSLLLDIKKSREEGSLTAYDGHVKGMSMDQLTNKVWSPSRLENLGKCPFKFFAENVLGIPEPDKENLGEDKWLEPTERGNIIHKVAEHYLAKLIQGLNPSNDEVLSVMHQAAEQKAIGKVPPSRMVYEKEISSMEALCLNIIKMEASYRKMLQEEGVELLPGKTVSEYNFDAVEVELSHVTGKAGKTLKMQGRLDRMDEMKSGARVIIDYKSGEPKYTEPGCFAKGRQLQLYLYSLMAEKQWNEYPKEAYYFFLKGSNPEKMRVTAALSEEQKEKTLQWLAHFYQLWQRGEFLLTDDFKKDCAFCPYEDLCNKTQYAESLLSQKWEATHHAKEVRNID